MSDEYAILLKNNCDTWKPVVVLFSWIPVLMRVVATEVLLPEAAVVAPAVFGLDFPVRDYKVDIYITYGIVVVSSHHLYPGSPFLILKYGLN